MPANYERSLYGVSRTRANDGFPIAELDGDGGGIVNVAIVFVGNNAANSLPTSNPTITLQLFPFGAAQVGTDTSGNIGVNDTWTRTPPPKNFYDPTGATAGSNFTDGFWGQDIRGVIDIEESAIPAGLDFIIQIQCLISDDFSPSASVPQIATLTAENIQFDEDEGEVTLSWTIPADCSDIDFFLIEYSWDNGANWNPWASAPCDATTYRDKVYVDTTTLYRVIPVTTDTMEKPDTDPPTVEVVFTDAPDIAITGSGGITFSGSVSFQLDPLALTGSGGIDLGGSATITYQGDPSGLYTLTIGKRYDTQYQRIGSEDTINVAIPRPFFKTAFVP